GGRYPTQDLAGGRSAPSHSHADRHESLRGWEVAGTRHRRVVQAAGRDPRYRHRGHRLAPPPRQDARAARLILDPVSGEVVELQPFNGIMSKRAAQIGRNLDRLEAEWEAEHPGEMLGPVMTARLQGIAWTHGRPGKKPADLKNE